MRQARRTALGADAPMAVPDRPSLPIEAALDSLRTALARHASVVLQAPPGAGKSTGVPLALLEEAWLGGSGIVMLEPRRLAARAVAGRMAALLGEQPGATVGYRTRLESRIGKQTRIEVVTEGILTRRLQHDAALEGVGLLIFDEFHERSLQGDLGLALSLEVQQNLREDLKILVMSATLDGEAVARLLHDAPIVNFPGRAFEVEVRWLEGSQGAPRRAARQRQDVAAMVCRAIRQASMDEPGDILAFLPGQAEIHRVQRQLADAGLPKGTRILPLYGALALDAQEAAMRPGGAGERRIVLATNIAETSLTIEGVRIVVDAGLERRVRFDPASGLSRLETLRISRAAAQQRRGRAGRLAPGICHRLWTQAEHDALPAHTPAEILEADLAPLALELAAWGIIDPRRLRWLDPPPAAAFQQARELLACLQGLDPRGRINAYGRALAQLGTHPRLAHMILRGAALGLQRSALEIAAVLGERDLLRTEAAHRNVDLRLRLEALRHGRLADRASGGQLRIDAGARRRALRGIALLDRQLERSLRKSEGCCSAAAPVLSDDDADAGRLLAFAFPERVAHSRGGDGRYLLANGRGAVLPPGQGLARAEFLVVPELDAGERDAAIRLAAPLQREHLMVDLATHIEQRERCEWDARSQAVLARDEQWLGAIKLCERRIAQPDGERMSSALLQGIRELGIQALPWSGAARSLQRRIMFARRTDAASWPDVGDVALRDSLEDWLSPWLGGMSRREHLARLDLHAILTAMLDWNLRGQLAQLAPTHLEVPSGSRIPIDYSGDAPSVAVRLQEVFGLRCTPTIGAGTTLTLQLLSPAGRPVQVTRDLAGFWQRGYLDVKKELKGRYPKHSWPQDPAGAAAVARAARRRS